MEQSIDQRITKGLNRVMVTLDMAGDSHPITFRSGGELTDPREITASAGGGMIGTGLYDSWSLEGEATMDSALHSYLVRVYKEKNFHYNTSAVVEVYTVTNNTSWKLSFENARISKLPLYAPAEAGGETTIKIHISLNDLKSDQIIQHSGDTTQ